MCFVTIKCSRPSPQPWFLRWTQRRGDELPAPPLAMRLAVGLIAAAASLAAGFATSTSLRFSAARRRHPPPAALTLEEVSSLIDQSLDTADDAALHFRRFLRGVPAVREVYDAPGDARPRLIVLGTGWAAHALVKTIDTDKYQVLVVSPRNFFLFTPMLAASCVGTVEYRSITEPIRAANPLVGYLEAACTDIDLEAREITVLKSGGASSDMRLPYDKMVVACGVTSSTFGVPGVAENCLFLKEVDDAILIRRAVGDAFERACAPGITPEERARVLTFVTVGGGPTGVEFTGELTDFVADVARRFYPMLIGVSRVILVETGSSILPSFDGQLRDTAKDSLVARGVEVILNARVTAVTAHSVSIQPIADAEGQYSIPCEVRVWAAGTQPRPLAQNLLSQLSPEAAAAAEQVGRAAKGKIPVDPWLRVIGAPTGSLLCMGDAAIVVEAEEVLPQTAQVAAQQGAFVSRLLNREYDLTVNDPGPVHPKKDDVLQFIKLRGAVRAPPFVFVNLGKLAYIGGGEALSQIELGKQRILTEAGSAGFLLWRSVYVVKQVAFRNRVLVLFDWVKTRVFGRDVTRF